MRNRKFEKWFLKLFVKSFMLYYSYLLLFILIFLISSHKLMLDVRGTYNATIEGNEVRVVCDSQIDYIEDKIFVYKDRDQEVYVSEIISSEYKNGIMVFHINKEIDNINGEVILEITTEKKTLLERIFAQAGKSI